MRGVGGRGAQWREQRGEMAQRVATVRKIGPGDIWLLEATTKTSRELQKGLLGSAVLCTPHLARRAVG